MVVNGSDEKLPDFPEVREEFNIKNTLKYTKPCMGKLSTYTGRTQWIYFRWNF